MGRAAASKAAVGLVLLLLALLMPVPMGNATPPNQAPHGPIVIEGHDDLCDDEDGDGVVGGDDGIANCGTADGTAENPYIVQDLEIRVMDAPVCASAPDPNLPTCVLPAGCEHVRPELVSDDIPANDDAAVFVAALNLCSISKHVLVRNVHIELGSPVLFAGEVSGPDCSTCTFLTVAIAALGASNLTFEDVSVSTAGTALRVDDATDTDGVEWAASNITLVRFEATPYEAPHPPPLDNRVQSLVSLVNSTVTIRDSFLDAANLLNGISAQGLLETRRGQPDELRLLDSEVRGALLNGVAAKGLHVVLMNDTFEDIGFAGTELPDIGADPAPTVTVDEGADGNGVLLDSATYDVQQNRFLGIRPGLVGLLLGTPEPGVVERNTFTQDSTLGAAIVVAVGNEPAARVRYNDFGGLRVENNDVLGSLDARRNWWGSDSGPGPSQTDGSVLTSEWLKAAPADLPMVRVESPLPESVVYGATRFQGSTFGTGASATRVELSFEADDWGSPLVADGINPWSLHPDFTGHPLGLHSVWLHACTTTECGAPLELPLQFEETPVPPIAILVAHPGVSNVGGSVVLDAGLSYSPLDHQVVLYRFEYGDGRVREWGPNSSASLEYDRPGTYFATAQVRDEQGLESALAGKATIRIRDDTAGVGKSGGLARLPAFEVGPLALAFLLAGLLRNPRRGVSKRD